MYIADNRPGTLVQKKQYGQGLYGIPGVEFGTSEPATGPVVQRAWTGALAGAALFGGIGAKLLGPVGGLIGTAIGAVGGHFAEEYFGNRQPAQVAPAFAQPADQGSFSANLAGRAAFNQELEQHVNQGAQFNAHNQTLTVSQQHLEQAAGRMNLREQAQRNYVQQALAPHGNQNIYDNTVAHHNAKNLLWQQMHQQVNNGVNADGAAMNPNVVLKAKTSLAQIVGTGQGHALMNQVWQLSQQLHVAINYIEDNHAQDFNLTVRPVYGNALVPAQLTALEVRLPSDNRYNDAQSFKRVSNVQHGVTDVQNLGTRISVSPVDTDFFHEFTHGLHYLTMEQRRQQGAALQQHDSERYDHVTASEHNVLTAQHEVAEARTIHRNASFHNLGQIPQAAALPAGPNQQYFQDMHTAFTHTGAYTQNIPVENDYRHELGLAPRQDHYAMRLNNAGNYEQGGMLRIVAQ